MRAAVPRWVWAVIAWVVVVAATSTLAWVAISRAGDEVLGAPSAPLPSSGSPTGTDPSSGPTTAQTSAPSGSSSTSSPSSSGTGSATVDPPAAAQPVDRTVSVTGGQVSVRCTGDAVSLRGAVPAGGWTLRDDSRADEVRVEFHSDAGESEVRAVCVSGSPEVEIDDAAD